MLPMSIKHNVDPRLRVSPHTLLDAIIVLVNPVGIARLVPLNTANPTRVTPLPPLQRKLNSRRRRRRIRSRRPRLLPRRPRRRLLLLRLQLQLLLLRRRVDGVVPSVRGRYLREGVTGVAFLGVALLRERVGGSSVGELLLLLLLLLLLMLLLLLLLQLLLLLLLLDLPISKSC